MSKWIKCSEQMPALNEKVIIRIDKKNVIMSFRLPFEPLVAPLDFLPDSEPFHWQDMECATFILDAWVTCGKSIAAEVVTHWRPLPEPPEES